MRYLHATLFIHQPSTFTAASTMLDGTSMLQSTYLGAKTSAIVTGRRLPEGFEHHCRRFQDTVPVKLWTGVGVQRGAPIILYEHAKVHVTKRFRA